MCEELKIKIAIIQRIWEHSPSPMISIIGLMSAVLGCAVSYDLARYVCSTSDNNILKDIANELPIAIELDNLKPNWN